MLAVLVLALPVALAACPQFASDWTIAGSRSDGDGDATVQDAGIGSDGRTEGGGVDGSPIDAADSGPIEAAVGTEAGADSGSVDSVSVSADAAPDACTPVTHSNGVGQTWTDCVPLGTYNEAQAMKACAAAGGGASCGSTACVDPSVVPTPPAEPSVFSTAFGWGYAGPNAGHVHQVSGSSCPTGSDPMWN